MVAVASAAGLFASAVEKANVEYSNAGGKPLLLDLHIPDGPGPFPAAILIHGGGFDGGSKSTNVKPLFEPFDEAGYAWFSIDYRLAPAAHFPQAMEDVDAAILWVKAHAAAYHVDPSKIVLIGESAGGLLVNYAGARKESPAPLAAVVDFYGPSSYAKLAQLRLARPDQFDMTTINRHASNGGGIHFFGVDKLDAAGLAKLESLAPIASVHRGMPPFLCIHGTKDDQVSYEQSTEFCEEIRKAGSECKLITIEGGGHGMSRWHDPAMQHWKPEMIGWLNQTLNHH